MPRIEIDQNKPLNPGDIIELDFKISGWVWSQAAEIALIESYCKDRTDWEIVSNSLPADNRITFKILIKSSAPQEPELQRAGLGVNCILIAGTIATAGVVGWLLLDKCYQVGGSTGGQIALSGAGAAGWALLIFIVYKYFGK